MKNPILIAGTGKTAMDWGLYLLSRDRDVLWCSRSEQRTQELEKKMTRRLKRYTASGGIISLSRVNEMIPEEGFSCILESIEENLRAKKKLWATLLPLLIKGGLALTNSSSLLPGRIHNELLGCHGFYPMVLTQSVELISLNKRNTKKTEQLREWLESLELLPLVQTTPERALAVNQLLIPVQNQVFLRLFRGESAEKVNEESLKAGFPQGLITQMEAIGYDTLLSALENYPPAEPPAAALISGCRILVESGRLGKKNSLGLLCGEPPKENLFTIKLNTPAPLLPFSEVWKETLSLFISRGRISERERDQILNRIFFMEEN